MLKNKTNATREISIFLHNILISRPTITVEKEVMDFNYCMNNRIIVRPYYCISLTLTVLVLNALSTRSAALDCIETSITFF
jgi:hypothetical protein